MKSTKFAQVAGIMLALVFSFSCSSGGGDDGTSSPSSGGDIQFNENSQIYNKDGTLYKGSGIIEATSYMEDSACYEGQLDCGGLKWEHVRAGNVTNGIVKLELPQTIPSEYLSDFFDDETQRSCTSYPKNIKMFGGIFVLTNSSKDYIGSLSTEFDDGQIIESVTYMYFTKAGKISCNYYDREIFNIDAKIGWNKIYLRGNYNSQIEYSTNNILTKEMKWILD